MMLNQTFQVNFEYHLLGRIRSKVLIFIDNKVAEAFPTLDRQAERWAAVYTDSIDLDTPIEMILGGVAEAHR